MLATRYAQFTSWLDNVKITFFSAVSAIFLRTQSLCAPLGMDDNVVLLEDVQLIYLAEGAANIVFRVYKKLDYVVKPVSGSSDAVASPFEGMALSLVFYFSQYHP